MLFNKKFTTITKKCGPSVVTNHCFKQKALNWSSKSVNGRDVPDQSTTCILELMRQEDCDFVAYFSHDCFSVIIFTGFIMLHTFSNIQNRN